MENTSNEAKAKQYIAKYMSYSNAAEFIRSHGEEGFAFADDKLNDLYIKQNDRTAKMLNNLAMKWRKKYIETGVDVDTTEVDY